jgi:hypothetical protein
VLTGRRIKWAGARLVDLLARPLLRIHRGGSFVTLEVVAA